MVVFEVPDAQTVFKTEDCQFVFERDWWLKLRRR
jgi:hypothetical protein